MQTLTEQPMVRPSSRIQLKSVAVLSTLLIALPWFWPILIPPRSEFLPDFVSWTAFALLLSLLLWVREQGARIVATGWLIAALGSAVLAIVQYLDLENRFFPWIAQTQPGIALANVHQINMLATLLGVGLLSVWWMGVRRHLKPWSTVWMAVLLLIGMAATASRTGMLHLITVTLLLFYWHWQDRWRVLLVVLSSLAVYLLAGWGLQWVGSMTSGVEIHREITSRFGTDNRCHSRLVLWRDVLELIALKPWTGWGPGGLLYAHYITPFEGIRYCEKLSNAHNWPLQMAVTLGLPVTVGFHAVFLWVIIRLKPWAAVDTTERLAWGVLLLIGIHSLLEYPMWFGVFQLMAGSAAWLLYFNRRNQVGPDGAIRTFLSSRKAMGMVTTLALAVLALVGWEYLKVSQLYLPASWRLERFRYDTLNKVHNSFLYQSHVLIAQVTMTPLTKENAHLILEGALESLHVAPDSRVIRRVIESAELLGRQDLVELHTARYKAAWPQQFAEWQAVRTPQSDRSSLPASPSAAPR
ncbi:Wzy polymerase domain-containing protein [Hydrogenophaga sp.]|uniref:PglL family O-oligosaccharyltransferase n=1 Tax=Hydrogenophaga sp. TaxID=1904254 RepID=UPI00286E4CC1|nr:Wzy polymerase domain-containing protein [Hydrogenophaga sp.]